MKEGDSDREEDEKMKLPKRGTSPRFPTESLGSVHLGMASAKRNGKRININSGAIFSPPKIFVVPPSEREP